MKSIINIYESLLDNIDNTMANGRKWMADMNVMHTYHELSVIVHAGDKGEKLFGDKIDDLRSLPWFSEKMDNTERRYKSRFRNTTNFGKWLERLTAADLNIPALYINSMSTAENVASTIEKLAKKAGLLKNAKNIKVVGRYFDSSPNDNFDRGQFQIEVQKVDKEGNVVKTKDGRTYVMYLFNCK